MGADTPHVRAGREAEASTPAGCCLYCGEPLGESDRGGARYSRLVTHIRNDCRAVPPSVQAEYRDRCPGGACRG